MRPAAAPHSIHLRVAERRRQRSQQIAGRGACRRRAPRDRPARLAPVPGRPAHDLDQPGREHEGIVAVSRKIAEDSQRKSEVKHEVKSLEKADHDKAIQTTLEKRKRDQALKDADRLNQQLTELRNESEGFGIPF